MPHNVQFPDSLYKRLQKHAVPFVDTPLTVIERWADYFDSKAASTSSSTNTSRAANAYDPSNPPNLLHTICRGHFGKEHIGEWNELLRVAHIQAHKKLKTFDEVRRITLARIRNGNHSDKGFHFIAEIGLSIQGVDANRAWTHSLRLAKALGVPIMVSFEWRNNDKAAFPGKTGVLEWSPLS